MQIKVTLDEVNYKCLKASALMNRRTLSAELNTILDKKYKDIRPDITVEKEIEREEMVSAVPEPIQEEPAIIQRKAIKARKQIVGGEDNEPKSNNPQSPTLNEFIEFLDKEEIPASDTSLTLFDGIKKQVYKKLELDVFDEAQKIRQERR